MTLTPQQILSYRNQENTLLLVLSGLLSTTEPTLVIMRGLPGSGKSTMARALKDKYPNVVLVSRDDIRELLFNKKVGLDFNDENLVTLHEDSIIRQSLLAGRHVVVHDLNLRPKYIKRFQELAIAEGAAFYTAEMPFDVDIAIARDALRSEPVGEKVIRDMAQKLFRKGEYLPLVATAPTEDVFEPYVPDLSKPKAVIFDLDGTLCGNTGRGWYDHDQYHTDSLNTRIGMLADLLHEAGYIILFVSGRKCIGYEGTALMLSKALPTIWADERTDIWMRDNEDNRDDAIVKYDLFDMGIRKYYNVEYVFDDRPKVLAMWHSIGLETLRCGDPTGKDF